MCGGRERSKISSPLIELDVLTTAELSALCYDHQDACLKAGSYKILNKCLILIKRTHRARCAQELSRGEGGETLMKKGWEYSLFTSIFLRIQKMK